MEIWTTPKFLLDWFLNSSGTNVHEQSRADVCRLRFKTDGFSRQYAYSQNMKLPGGLVYDSSKYEADCWNF